MNAFLDLIRDFSLCLLFSCTLKVEMYFIVCFHARKKYFTRLYSKNQNTDIEICILVTLASAYNVCGLPHAINNIAINIRLIKITALISIVLHKLLHYNI